MSMEPRSFTATVLRFEPHPEGIEGFETAVLSVSFNYDDREVPIPRPLLPHDAAIGSKLTVEIGPFVPYIPDAVPESER